MRKVVLCICLVWLLAPTLAAAESLTDSTGKLRGRVIDAYTGDPIPGVPVQLLGTTIGALTNPSGDYTIILVPAGVYTLSIKAIGWQQSQIDRVAVAPGQTTLLDFSLESRSVTEAIASNDGAERVVIGQVVEAGTGEPVPDARISALGTRLSAMSNVNGNYALRHTPSGTFTIICEARGFRPTAKRCVCYSGSGVDFVDLYLETDTGLVARHTFSQRAWDDLRLSETQTIRKLRQGDMKHLPATNLTDILRTQIGFVRR